MRILAVSDLRVQSIRLLEQVAGRVNPDLILYGGDDVVRFGPGPHSWSPLASRTRYGLAGVIGNDCSRDHAAALRQAAIRTKQTGYVQEYLTPPDRVVEVVSGALIRDGRVWLAQRHPSAVAEWSEAWCLPGGKVEAGESVRGEGVALPT